MNVTLHRSTRAGPTPIRQRMLAGAVLAGGLLLPGCALWPAPRETAAVSRRDVEFEASQHVIAAMQEYQQGDIAHALDSVRRAREIDPQLQTALELEALFLADLGQTAMSVDAMRALLQAHPQSAHLQSRVGQMLVRSGAQAEGLAAMQRGVMLAPQQTVYARELAGVLVDLGDSRGAILALKAGLERNPTDEMLPVSLARLHEAAGEWEPALNYYTLTLQRHPDNVAWRRQRARCLYRLGDFGRAIREFQTCLEADVNSLGLADRIEFGDACLRAGDVDRASWVFGEIAASGRATKEIETLRGVCELRRGDAEAAGRIFTAALQRWPDDASLTMLLDASRRSPSGVVPAAGEFEVQGR
jgi:tetratricopeptide (TPR) repeat protein